MKTNILLFAALVLSASCSRYGSDEENPKSPDNIRFDATTTRAAIATITELEAGGFKVWGTAANTAGWYGGINGIMHTYNDGTWDFATPMPWPTDGAAYPMDFYAVFPSSTTVAATPGADPGQQSLISDFTVATDAAAQIDLLGSKGVANIKPADGNLAMVFHHLLSKVDFGLQMGNGFAASIQGLTLNNIGNSGTYTYTGTPAWTTPPSSYTTKYAYYGTIHDDPAGHTTDLGNFQCLGSADGTVVPFYDDLTTPPADKAHLMLMPQANAAQFWGAGSAPAAVPDTQSYVAMVYRLGQDGHDLIGFANAGSHKAFAGSQLQASGYNAMDPLFVKVGYPFDLNWAQGKGYTYNINLGGGDGITGGYLLDQNYYDKYGNRTGLIVGDTDGDGDPDGPRPPRPMLDGTNIHLVPITTPWEDGGDPIDLN